MNLTRFEQLVGEGIHAIPEKFLNKLDNVGIVIEDEPSPEQRKKLKLRRNITLLGLYEGIPPTKRGAGYSGVLPDKITIFMNPILEGARSEAEVREIVRDTVWHEIAHHFGMNEVRTRKAQTQRKRRI